MSLGNNIVVVNNITKQYNGKTVLSNISFSIDRAMIFSLLGPNGAGKTTLLSIIAGITPPSGGYVKIKGADPRDPSVRRVIGYCPQEPALYDTLNAIENMIFYARLYGISEREATKRGNELLELFGLKDHKKKLVGKYSGGMKKRLSLAITLLVDPEILILDEPTTGMDPGIRRDIWKIIRGLKNEDKTVILATHNMEEADVLSDTVAIIDRGKLIATGSPEELKLKYGPSSVIHIEIPEDYVEKAYDILKKSYSETHASRGAIKVYAKNPDEDVPRIVSLLYKGGVRIDALRVIKPSLEDVFIKLTGRGLEQNEA